MSIKLDNLLHDSGTHEIKIIPAIDPNINRDVGAGSGNGNQTGIVKKKTSNETDFIILFSFLMKIHLGSKDIKSLNNIFIDLLSSKINSSEALRLIEIVVNERTLLKEYLEYFTKRKSRPTYDELADKLSEVIRLFLEHGYPNNKLYSYVYLISNLKVTESGYLSFLPTISSREYNTDGIDFFIKLINSSKILFYLLPERRLPVKEKEFKKLSLRELYDIDEPEHIYRKSENLPNIAQTQNYSDSEEEAETEKKVATSVKKTPCYINRENEFDIPSGSFGFLYNLKYRSYPVEAEYSEVFQQRSNQKTLFEVFEDVEVNEHKVDRIYAFTDNNPFANYSASLAGESVFKKKWKEIEPYIEDDEIRQIAIDTCRAYLPELENQHRSLLKYAHQFVSTKPTNTFLREIHPPNAPKQFEINASRAFYFVSHILMSFHNSKLQSIFKYLYEAHILCGESSFQILCPKCIYHVLYYFSTLSRRMEPIVNTDFRTMTSIEMILETVGKTEDDFYKYFYEDSKSCVYEIFTSIILQNNVSDEITRKAYNYLGENASCIAEFFPILDHIFQSCKAIECYGYNDGGYNLFKIIDLFGKGSKERLESLKPLYVEVVRSMVGDHDFEQLVWLVKDESSPVVTRYDVYELL